MVCRFNIVVIFFFRIRNKNLGNKETFTSRPSKWQETNTFNTILMEKKGSPRGAGLK